MSPAAALPTVLIGIGNVMRHDDGVGPAAVAMAAERFPAVQPGVELDLLVLDGEPTRLVEAWRGRRLAIVVDAARSASPAGAIHRVEVGCDALPSWTGRASTHSAGLAEAVALARALDVLPGRLVVFGVEAGDLSLGEGLTPAVRAALAPLIDGVAAEARRWL